MRGKKKSHIQTEGRIRSNFGVPMMRGRKDRYLGFLFLLFEVLTACWREQGKGIGERKRTKFLVLIEE